MRERGDQQNAKAVRRSEAIDRTPKPPKGSAAKAAVTATAPEADAASTPAATPRVRTAESKQRAAEAIDRTPKSPER